MTDMITKKTTLQYNSCTPCEPTCQTTLYITRANVCPTVTAIHFMTKSPMWSNVPGLATVALPQVVQTMILCADSHWSPLRKRRINSADSTLRELLVEPGVTDSGFHIGFPSHRQAVFAGFEFRRGRWCRKALGSRSQRSTANVAAPFVRQVTLDAPVGAARL